jgi:acetolactate synthase I/III small subunit
MTSEQKELTKMTGPTPLPVTRAQRAKPHIFTAYVEDLPGVLSTITSLFARRGYNIISLTVGRTEKAGVSRMTIVLDADDAAARLVEANLYKLVNVLRVEDVTDEATVVRDLVLVKVHADATSRPQILQLCDIFRARVVDIVPEALIIEATGTEDKLQGLVEVLVPFGITELVRTGSVVMTRGSSALTANPHFVNAQVPDDATGASSAAGE